KLPIGAGVDGVAFDKNKKMIFTPNGEDGTISAYYEKSGNDFVNIGTITTKSGARTITIDSNTGDLFLPTAEFEAADPKNEHARRKLIPGTFQVLKVGK
ncbi:MAG: YncE family protein, partial [Ginsengibacter sp.]